MFFSIFAPRRAFGSWWSGCVDLSRESLVGGQVETGVEKHEKLGNIWNFNFFNSPKMRSNEDVKCF